MFRAAYRSSSGALN